MNQLRIATVYSLLLFALEVGAGFILGVVERIIGLEHQWGFFDIDSAIRLILTVAIVFGVFAALIRRHAAHYYTAGGIVVLLSIVLGVISAYLVAPQSARDTYNWSIAWASQLVLNAGALIIVGLFWRMRQSSSNTSLERPREG